MKKLISVLIFFYISVEAQINIYYINHVPESFKEEYSKKPREFNPLHIGDVWQYYFGDNTTPFYRTTRIVGDSIINGKKYFKKISYQVDSDENSANFISWERNDTLSGVSFMLDFQDVNENGDYLDELPLDSLELPLATRYLIYRYSFNDEFFWSGSKTGYVYDSSWVVIAGDTVISRRREIIELFWTEEIADKFGIFATQCESPIRWLTGAIINGKKYGTIVDIEEENTNRPAEIRLEDNYPNPFNPITTINYQISFSAMVTLKIFDVSGKEVALLINERKNIGSYSVRFDAAMLSSGVYYYTLIAGSRKITKKMIFLK